MIAYLCDGSLRQKLNKNNRNYWDVYIREIAEQLGLSVERVSLSQLEDEPYLSKIATLIIGWQSGAALSAAARDNLRKWVRRGGLLIGFGVQGLDELFGIEPFSRIAQSPNDYTLSGYFEFMPHPLTQGIHSSLSPKQKLLIFSDMQQVEPKGAIELAHLYDRKEKDAECPAILWHQYGAGHAAYFAFDVAKTIWLLHQGRPYTKKLDKDEKVYRGDLRLAEIGKDKAGEVLYADGILFLLQNIIAQKPHPFIYQIPPKGTEIPEALLYWSGDGCGSPGSKGLLAASDFMKSKGLPYNIHVLSRGGSYDLTPEDAEAIQKNGHELSIEYYFCYYSKDHFDLEITDEESLAGLYRIFKERYDVSTISTGCHGGYYAEEWGGWIEDMKWRMRCGGKADNTFMGLVPEDVDSNAPRLCFGHGTAYPYYFYDDFREENKRINFIEEPLTAYELGRRGGTGDPDESVPPEEIRPAIDMAVQYHLTLNMFYHAVNIAKHPATRRAIEEVLRYIAEKNVCVVHVGTDELWRWWDARSKSQVSDIKTTEDDHLCFQADCKYSSGMIVKTVLPNYQVIEVLCDAVPAVYKVRNEFGNNWMYTIVPKGKHEVEVIRKMNGG
jgi:hypothetical protein